MTSDNSNYSAWKHLQVQINENKAERYDFSKTPIERAALQTAKSSYRSRMRMEMPGWTKRSGIISNHSK